MIKYSEKRNNNTTLGYIQTYCGYWITTAPKGCKYDSKQKVWVLNNEE